MQCIALICSYAMCNYIICIQNLFVCAGPLLKKLGFINSFKIVSLDTFRCYSRIFWKIPEYSKIFQTIPEYLGEGGGGGGMRGIIVHTMYMYQIKLSSMTELHVTQELQTD